jgi:hypothetical protein
MMIDENIASMQNGDETDFYKQVADLLVEARKYAKKQMDSTITIGGVHKPSFMDDHASVSMIVIMRLKLNNIA